MVLDFTSSISSNSENEPLAEICGRLWPALGLDSHPQSLYDNPLMASYTSHASQRSPSNSSKVPRAMNMRQVSASNNDRDVSDTVSWL